MAIDLSQFHQVFFEESFENVEIMENSLMALEPAAVDGEIINAIFRAAHSIKGGSATFGFRAISEFTHVLETLLDQIRAGARKVSKDDIDLFLQAVDCIREMLSMLQAGDDAETNLSREVLARFNALLAGEEHATPARVEAPAAPQQAATASASTWKITLAPGSQVLKTGNDPLRLIKELMNLGEIDCHANLDRLPKFSAMDAEAIYLSWVIELKAEVERTQIDEIFAWIEDESDISIDRLAAPAEAASASGGKHGAAQTFWSIAFIPKPQLLRTGNDPVKLFHVLADIGDVTSVTHSATLPSFTSMDAELCYLSWEILLSTGEAQEHVEQQVQQVFEWVADECELAIKPVSGLFDQQRAELASEPVLKTAAASKVGNAKPPTDAQPKAAKLPTKSAASPDSSSIRVGIDKVDNLINMVGELVITQSMLGQLGTDFALERLPKLLEGLGQLEQNTRELQESVMRIRMLPISFVFSRFPRMVRDLSQSLHKDVELEILGDQTELDKTVLEKIGDPLVHLVRNAVDHGIETVEERREKGKSGTGRVTLNAYHQGGNVVIEVRDDGKGLDPQGLKKKAVEKNVISAADAESLTREQAFDLIFQPGFSTAKEISDVSGRGVGMDVVKRNIQALNGVIDIQSEVDAGSTITIRLPLTLAILDGQLVRVADQTYIFPIVSIVESLQCKAELINRVAGGSDVFRLRDEYVPIIQLAQVFNIPFSSEDLEGSLMVVVESEGEKVGIVVNELLAQQQVVIKSLEQNYRRVAGVSGATILGDGTVALIVDIPGIVRLAGDRYKIVHEAARSALVQHPVASQARL